MSRFEEIKKGFEEAIAYTKGEGEGVHVHRYAVLSLAELGPVEIHQNRLESGISQDNGILRCSNE